jgi:hypothetical protein
MEAKNEYDEQAEKFLRDTETEFSAKFLRTDKYFPDDTDKRDIYEITLKRGERRYSFTFGQSLKSSGEYIVYPGKVRLSKKEATAYVQSHGDIVLNRGNSDKNKDYEILTPYTVLASLTKYEPGTFENFCWDYGYDNDSRKAEKMYEAVKEEYAKLCTLYSDKELEEMQAIQ